MEVQKKPNSKYDQKWGVVIFYLVNYRKIRENENNNNKTVERTLLI